MHFDVRKQATAEVVAAELVAAAEQLPASKQAFLPELEQSFEERAEGNSEDKMVH